jgi:hypothetical protein
MQFLNREKVVVINGHDRVPRPDPNVLRCCTSLNVRNFYTIAIRGSRDTPGRVSELSHGPARGQGLVQPLFSLAIRL